MKLQENGIFASIMQWFSTLKLSHLRHSCRYEENFKRNVCEKLGFYGFPEKNQVKWADEYLEKDTKGHNLYLRVQKRTFFPQGVLLSTCQEKEYG